MRILFCGINYAPDLVGIAKYNTELCEALSARGHEVRVVTAPPYYPQWKVAPPFRTWAYQSDVINGVKLLRTPLYVPKNPSGTRRILHHASFALANAIPAVTAALRWRPHVVFSVAPSLMSAPTAALVARLAGARSWLHIQDFEVDAAFDLGLLQGERSRKMMLSIERTILGAFDRVSTISPQMLRRLERKGVDAARLREVRNWIDVDAIVPTDRMTTFRQELGIGATDLVALYSGSMSNKQGTELIIEAARKIQGTHPCLDRGSTRESEWQCRGQSRSAVEGIMEILNTILAFLAVPLDHVGLLFTNAASSFRNGAPELLAVRLDQFGQSLASIPVGAAIAAALLPLLLIIISRRALLFFGCTLLLIGIPVVMSSPSSAAAIVAIETYLACMIIALSALQSWRSNRAIKEEIVSLHIKLNRLEQTESRRILGDLHSVKNGDLQFKNAPQLSPTEPSFIKLSDAANKAMRPPAAI